MTYYEALAEFKRTHADAVARKPQDKPALGEAWSAEIDRLARDGKITKKQASRWGNPFYR